MIDNNFHVSITMFLNCTSSTLFRSPSSTLTDIKCSQCEEMWYIITFENVIILER